jgi:hypothetical protein
MDLDVVSNFVHMADSDYKKKIATVKWQDAFDWGRPRESSVILNSSLHSSTLCSLRHFNVWSRKAKERKIALIAFALALALA